MGAGGLGGPADGQMRKEEEKGTHMSLNCLLLVRVKVTVIRAISFKTDGHANQC